MAIVEANQYGVDIMPLKIVRSPSAVILIIFRCLSTNTVVYFNIEKLKVRRTFSRTDWKRSVLMFKAKV